MLNKWLRTKAGATVIWVNPHGTQLMVTAGHFNLVYQGEHTEWMEADSDSLGPVVYLATALFRELEEQWQFDNHPDSNMEGFQL